MKDMLSNELAVGDPVIIKYGNEWITGLLVKIQNGGLSLGVGNLTQKNPQAPQVQQTADVIVVQVTIPLAGPPGLPQQFIARLDAKNLHGPIGESSLKM